MNIKEDLKKLCESISEEISKVNRKIEKSGGDLSAGDVEYIRNLTHSLKSVKTVMAMMEQDGGESYGARGYSRRRYREGGYGAEGGYGENYGEDYGYGEGNYGESYGYGENYGEGGGYSARGRGRNARRDSMGRYASSEAWMDKLKDIEKSAPNEQMRTEIKRFISRME